MRDIAPKETDTSMNTEVVTAIGLLVAAIDTDIPTEQRSTWEIIKERLEARIASAFPTAPPSWNMYLLKDEWSFSRLIHNPFIAARLATLMTRRNHSVILLTGNGEQEVFGHIYFLKHHANGAWQPFVAEDNGLLWVDASKEYALRMAQTQSKRQHDLWGVFQSKTVRKGYRYVNEYDAIAKYQDGAEVSIFAGVEKCPLATGF